MVRHHLDSLKSSLIDPCLVTDRLAYLNYVHGALAEKLATSLDKSRGGFKALRDAENNLTPRRNIRAGFQSQIARIEHDQQRGSEKRILELKQQLQKAEREDEPLEKELEILKRKSVRDSEQAKWAALREVSTPNIPRLCILDIFS